MIGIASYLLEKDAGLKQVKRMLEAAQKSPEAAKRLAFHRKPGEWGMPFSTNYYRQELDNPMKAVDDHLAHVNQHLADSRAARSAPDKELQSTRRGWGNSVVHTNVPTLEERWAMRANSRAGSSRGLVDYQVKDFTPTAHAQDLEKLRQQTGKRMNEDFGITGAVSVYDLGKVRPIDHVGFSSPHTGVDSLRGSTKGYQHLPAHPKHPRSIRARMAMEFEGSKPVQDQAIFETAKQRGGVNVDPRFETVVSGSYLKDKKIGEFVQIPKSRGNPDSYTLDTALKDKATARDKMKANLAGQSRDSGGLPNFDPLSSSALQQALKSRQFNRARPAPHSEFYKPLQVQPQYHNNIGEYYTELDPETAARWAKKDYPSEARYVGKGRRYGYKDNIEAGTSYWTSQLIPTVPTVYAQHMDLSKGNLYYKTDNPKAFGKAMNKYLDKPIEGS